MVLHSFDPHSSELVGKRVCKNVEQPAKKPFLNVVVVSISSQFSQVLSLVLPHIERRCGRNGLKLGMLLSRHQKLGEYRLPGDAVCKPFGAHKFPSPSQRFF